MLRHMTDISEAIKSKQARLTQLQADLDALERAASIMGGKAGAKARKRRGKMSAAARKALSQKLKAHWAKKKAASKSTPKKKRRKMSAAQRKAVGKRMKAYWAAKRKGKKSGK